MTISSNYSEEAIVGRESLFRRKLGQLRSTGEIKRITNKAEKSGFKEIEQNIYLNNVSAHWSNSDARQLEKVALLDSLTELYNHDTIIRMLKNETKRALRYKRDLSLLSVKIDCLNRTAKMHMDAVYDSVLKGTTQTLLGMIRDVDIPGRYDIDRILIICPETGAAGAYSLAERLRQNISLQSGLNYNQHLTISIGIASFFAPARNDEQLSTLALNALNECILAGGNTIRLAK